MAAWADVTDASGTLRAWRSGWFPFAAGAVLAALCCLVVPWNRSVRKERVERALRDAIARETEGRYAEAATLLERALAVDPHHPAANHQLARLCDFRLCDDARARRHYERYLDVAPGLSEAETAAVARRLAALTALADGRREDPRDAARDLSWAARAGAEEAFRERLTPAVALSLRRANQALDGYARRCWDVETLDVVFRHVEAEETSRAARVRARVRYADGAESLREWDFALAPSGQWRLDADRPAARP